MDGREGEVVRRSEKDAEQSRKAQAPRHSEFSEVNAIPGIGSLATPAEKPFGPWALCHRYVLFPLTCAVLTWDRAVKRCVADGERIAELARCVPLESLREENRLDGICGERPGGTVWTVEMLLEHLIDAGVQVATVLVDLTHGRKPSSAPDFSGPQPCGGRGAQVVEDFQAFVGDFAATLAEDAGDPKSCLTLAHRWLGELTAHQWLCLAAQHQRAHRRQMEAIVARLRGHAAGTRTEDSRPGPSGFPRGQAALRAVK